MRLSSLEIFKRKKTYAAYVWEENDNLLYLEFYSTKNEAIKAVKAYKKSYKGKKVIECYVKLYDENGYKIADYNI